MSALNTNDRAKPQSFELGLLGHPVSHSLSPVMHEAALHAVGLEGGYAAIDVPDAVALSMQLQRLRDGVLHGLNVTIPWKIEAAARCDRRVGAADMLGAANTLMIAEDGALVGYNTDVEGLERAVREAFPVVAGRGRVAAILGAGGAGRSAVLAARQLGFDTIRVYNRTFTTAADLVDALGCGLAVTTPAEALVDAALVIQASSVGFRLDTASSERLADDFTVPMGLTAPDAVLYDVIYAPRMTAWMIAAQRNGRRVSDGLGMLAHQAALAFELWTGRRPPVDVMMAAALKKLSAS